MSLDHLVQKTKQQFTVKFNQAPRWLAAAPGRVNVIGEHTDYNDGFVLPMAIENCTLAAAAPASNGAMRLRLCSGEKPEMVEIPLNGKVARGEPAWANYVRGVIAGFQDLGIQLPALDIFIESDVPLGGGLSSSASLEVATATLLEVVTSRQLDPVQKALLCQKAEHEYAGMPCGIMDQFISVMGKAGHLLLLDCRSRQTELVPMNDPKLSFLIVNTNVKHELTGGGYARRREQCYEAARVLGVPMLRDATLAQLEAAKDRLDPVVYRRARHVIGEIERTTQAAREIKAGNWAVVGQLMYASHDSLRDDYEVSCPELDTVVELARNIGPSGGVIGCRMTGGGFGGCAVALVEAARVEQLTRQITQGYVKRTGIQPSCFVSRPANGARVIAS
ncbi:galactokinase [Fontisphaera persica]|uniref:galactokinase n=1 Tax=Fontisphaera persica TaxID=2974023 RepID=UPI0024BF1B7F|nr:galactokinase [Fontisphaera persica]WCJ60343.1 galactokinase [Fontisphaera persica]